MKSTLRFAALLALVSAALPAQSTNNNGSNGTTTTPANASSTTITTASPVTTAATTTAPATTTGSTAAVSASTKPATTTTTTPTSTAAPSATTQTVTVAVTPAASTSATTAATTARASAAFELPRRKANAKAGTPGQMPKEHATTHELSSNGSKNARSKSKQGVSYVEIDPNSAWSSPVRGAPKDTTFISFFLCASEGTSIDLAGAKLLVHAAKKTGYAQLQIGRPTAKGMQWRDFGGPIKIEKYDGASLAALPVLTARLDPVAGVWDLYVGSRLGVADLPLKALPTGATRQFAIHAGAKGALLSGLISSDDNPIYEDENCNGIDDAFEKQQNRGALLTTSGPARTRLAQEWQKNQQSRQLQSWAVQRPLPDGVPAKPVGK